LYYLALFPYSLSIPDISELLRDGFNEAVARNLYAPGEEIVVWVMLQLAVLAHQKAVASSEVHPSTPSGAIPVYLKEPSKKRCENPAPNLVIPVLFVLPLKKSPAKKAIVWNVARIATVFYVREVRCENVTSKISPNKPRRK
jgi:hypothetical protein